MKKNAKFMLLLLAVALLTVGICGCSSTSKSVDDQFIDALQKGLSARWDLTNKKDATETEKSDWEKYIDAEYEQIAEFKDKTFENAELEKYAKEYIDAIEKSKEALEYFGTEKWASVYENDIYQQRSRALYNINKIHPLEFNDEDDQNALKNLLVSGEASEMAYKIQNEMKFELVEESYSYKQYQAVWENTTSSNFNYFQIDIALIDASGVTVETEHASAENWNSGEKTLFKFATNSQFEKMEIKSMTWSY